MQAAKSLNVCNLINCPFANTNPTPPRSSGCTRYSVSNHCHLMNKDLKFRNHLKPNQYWLFTTENINIDEIKKYNNWYIANDDASQSRLKFESEL